jgi:hypothetical protein
MVQYAQYRDWALARAHALAANPFLPQARSEAYASAAAGLFASMRLSATHLNREQLFR